MKAMILVLSPRESRDLLNGDLSVLARKKFPKDYVGWVYAYCKKGKPNLWLPYEHDCFELDEASQPYLSDKPILDIDIKMNGKVVAKFMLNKVEKIVEMIYQEDMGYFERLGVISMNDTYKEFLDKVCLSDSELNDYLEYLYYKKPFYGYALCIDKETLDIFYKPKELSEFYKSNDTMEYIKSCWEGYGLPDKDDYDDVVLTRAPRSGWCYINKCLENN